MTFTIVSAVAAMLAAIMLVLGIAVALWITSMRRQGFISYFAPLMFFMTALSVLASSRNLSIAWDIEEIAVVARPTIVVWFSRFVSVFLVMASLERIVSYMVEAGSGGVRTRRIPVALLLAFLFMWTTTVLSPALFGAVPLLSHEYFYTLFIGCAALTVGRYEGERAVELTRDAAMVFMLASLIVIPILPLDRTLELSYGEGWIPGVPRLYGLALHAVGLGAFALIGLLCLWNRPYRSQAVNAGAWVLGLLVLFAAQSKTAWVALVICAVVVLLVRGLGPTARWVTDRSNASAVAAMLIAAAVAVVGLSGFLAFAEVGDKVAVFLTSDEGARLMTLTGRERIWEIALQEWERHPVFGFGPTLFDEMYRVSIGIVSATHGHNQFVDTLARAGVVGVIGIVLYLLTLGYYSMKFAVATRGLTLALFLLMVQRSITEVPFHLFGYNPENIPHFTLLMVIAGQISARATAAATTRAREKPRVNAVRPGSYARS